MPYFPPKILIQTASTALAADSATTSQTFVDLLSLTLTTDANPLIIHAAGSFSLANAKTTAGIASARVTVDGTSVGAASSYYSNTGQPQSWAIAIKTAALTAGSHTIKVQWDLGQNNSSLQCRPATLPDLENTTLIVLEVSS